MLCFHSYVLPRSNRLNTNHTHIKAIIQKVSQSDCCSCCSLLRKQSLNTLGFLTWRTWLPGQTGKVLMDWIWTQLTFTLVPSSVRSSLPQCGLEVPVRCTSWPWVAHHSWAGRWTSNKTHQHYQPHLRSDQQMLVVTTTNTDEDENSLESELHKPLCGGNHNKRTNRLCCIYENNPRMAVCCCVCPLSPLILLLKYLLPTQKNPFNPAASLPTLLSRTHLSSCSVGHGI